MAIQLKTLTVPLDTGDDQEYFIADTASELQNDSYVPGANIKEALETVSDATLGKYEQVEATPGPIVTFDDGADNIPVKKMSVNIEPVQDLHGYDHPWPAGGGKNLLKTPYSDSSKTSGGITVTVNDDGSVTFKGTATTDVYWNFRSSSDRLILPTGTYIASINNIPSSCAIYFTGGTYLNNVNLTREITISDDSGLTAYISIPPSAGAVNFTLKLQIESGTTATSWTPYSNICPITGHTSAKVTRTGKNLAGWPIGRTITSAGVTFTVKEDGGISCKGTSTGTTWGPGDSDQVLLKAGTYFVTLQGYENMRAVLVNDSISPSRVIYPNNNIFTLNEDTLVHAYITGNTGITYDETVYFKLYLASENRDYEPYVSETYDITFPSEAGTVYGGTLEVNDDGTGTLTVDRKQVSATLENTNRNNATSYFIPVTDAVSGGLAHSAMSNVFRSWNTGMSTAEAGICFVNSAGAVRFNTVNSYASASELLAAIPDISLVYPLATPQIYSLTVPQVKTLLGLNNIWADTGDITELVYRSGSGDSAAADMIAPVEKTMTAEEPFDVGDLVIVKSTLYKVTSPIATGETLNPGVNCEATTIDEALKAQRSVRVPVTLTASGWSNGAQTVTVAGVSSDVNAQVIEPIPADNSKSEYCSKGVWCDSQDTNSLMFKYWKAPDNDLDVNIIITEVQSNG